MNSFKYPWMYPAQEVISGAWELINHGKESHTLFLIENTGKIVATLTDGDIRRGLLNGLNLENPAIAFGNKNFYHLLDTDKSYVSYLPLLEKGIKRIPLLNIKGELTGVEEIEGKLCKLPVAVWIMAGGRGERLRPLTDTTPKPLLPVGNYPLIGNVMNWLFPYGIKEVHVALHYEAQQIQSYLENNWSQLFEFDFFKENTPLGTWGSLAYLASDYPWVLVINADILTDLNIEAFYLSAINSQADIQLVAIDHEISMPFALLSLNKSNQLLEIIEKPQWSVPINAGIYLVKTDLLKSISQGIKLDAPDWIAEQILKELKINAFHWKGNWKDVGRWSDYESVK